MVEKIAIDGGSPYSAAVKAGNLLFLSGQVPDRHGITPNSIQEQTKLSLEGILTVLEKAGGKITDLVKLNIYLTKIEDFSDFNRAYREFFEAHGVTIFPARATVAIAALVKSQWKIEIEGVAVI